MKTVKISPQNFTVWYQPNKPSVRKILLNKLPYTASCHFAAYGKILPTFFSFFIFFASEFSCKNHQKYRKTWKTSVCTENFSKVGPVFFSRKSKIRPVLGGVALNFLELPICHKNCTYLSTTMRTQVSYTICHCHISAHNAHQSNLRKNTVLKLPRNKILYL